MSQIETKPCNFINIFNWQNNNEKVEKVTIPIIQRDYAQGRDSEEIEQIRDRFLEVLFNALVNEKKQSLDFIYGNIEENELTPLDGQQRLTTLFLLHYYIAKRENIEESKYIFLKNFTYETRPSSESFCERLISFKPDFDSEFSISNQIRDEVWFLMEWESDPTVCSMLVMLDSIHNLFNEKFYKRTDEGKPNLWEKLNGDNITFYFLPIKQMGLTDELYIKMNSRGKPLTPFEHWKAEFELTLKKYDDKLSESISQKIDNEWTNMLWTYMKPQNNKDYQYEDNIDDTVFLRYVHFISDIIRYKQGKEVIKKDFDIISELFNKDKAESFNYNISFLENMFDLWCKFNKENTIEAFFKNFITNNKHEEGKIIIGKEIDLFSECCKKNEINEKNKRGFTLNQFLILYAFILYLTSNNKISDENFRRRLRILNNLINNSEDNLRVDYMQGLIKQTEEIIIDGKIEIKDGSAHFNNNQIEEEIVKLDWTKNNPDKAEILYKLEDHPLLNGYINVIGLDNIVKLSNKFKNLFFCDNEGKVKCNFDIISKALLAIGDYSQPVGNNRFQLGTSETIWRKLFSPIGDRTRTKKVLVELLEKLDSFTKDSLDNVANKYIDDSEKNKEFTWRYYLVKYDSIRETSKYGLYFKRNIDEEYSLTVITKERLSSYNYDVFLKAIYDNANDEIKNKLELGDSSYSEYITDGNVKLNLPSLNLFITVESDCYKVYKIISEKEKEVIETIKIPQKQVDGKLIDSEDRVIIGLELIKRVILNNPV